MTSRTSSSSKHTGGALFWTLPMAYVFVDPYQRQAALLEWSLTSVGFVVALCLCVVGVRHSRDTRVTSAACAASLLLAIVFMAFRPAGAIFFPLAAVFAPLAVAGHIGRSVALIALILAVFMLQVWLSGSPALTHWLVYAAGFETVLIGAAMIFVARQTRAVERLHKSSERERIARDLHDTLGQSLSSIALKSELARRIFEQSPQRALAEIADIEVLSRRVLDEMRETIQGYHSGDVQSEFNRARDTLTTAGIVVESECDPREIDPASERVLALVLREAVTNVLRHAQASHCRLTLERRSDTYRLSIQDDGRGGIFAEGLGMRSVRMRVESLGGSAWWEVASGTRLTVAIPIPTGTPPR